MTSPEPVGSQTADFTVLYDGSAVADHTMPIRELAPALLALGQAFDRANSLINGDSGSLSLEIRATQQGSFEIVMVLKHLLDQGTALFSGDFFSSAANIKELFFGSGIVGSTGGLFWLIKGLRGRRPTVVEQNATTVVLEIENVRLTIPTTLLTLYSDPGIREQIEAAVRPVTKEGIDRVTFRDGERALETVTKDEAPYFRSEDLDFESVTTTVIPRQRLRPATVSFARNNKWRLTDGDKTRWYTITDEQFIKQVTDGSRRFGRNDLLVCEVVMTQSVEAGGVLKMEFAISDVISHIEAPTQAKMIVDTGGVTFVSQPASTDVDEVGLPPTV